MSSNIALKYFMSSNIVLKYFMSFISSEDPVECFAPFVNIVTCGLFVWYVLQQEFKRDILQVEKCLVYITWVFQYTIKRA